MKKTLAILLALILALVNVSLALAGSEGVEEEEPAAATSQVVPLASQTVTITKTYNVQGTTAINAADTLKFVPTTVRVDNATAGVTAPDISIADVKVDTAAKKATISIVLPEYKAVGEYYYTITETDTGVAGVTYLADTIYLKVQVFQDQASNALTTGSVTFRLGSETAEKVEEFENTYEAGSLTVSKTVAGNMGDYDKDWNFTVVFTAPSGDKVIEEITVTAEGATAPAAIVGGWDTTQTSTFVLKHNQSVKFSNIPKGVTYTVTETEANQDGYVTTIAGNDGSISGHEDDTAAFTNTKKVDIDTGVTVETVPYIMILAVVMIGAALLVLRKREEY